MSREARTLPELIAEGRAVIRAMKRDGFSDILWEKILDAVEAQRSENAPIKSDEFNTFWGFQFKDGSYWTDDIFDDKDRAVRFRGTEQGAILDGADLVEIVFMRKSERYGG